PEGCDPAAAPAQQRNAPPSQAVVPPASPPNPDATPPQAAPAQQSNAPPSQAVVPPASPSNPECERRRAIRLASAKSDLVPVFEKKGDMSAALPHHGSESCPRVRAPSPYLNDLVFSWVGKRVRLARDETQAGRLA